MNVLGQVEPWLLLRSLIALVRAFGATFVPLRWHDEDDKRLRRKKHGKVARRSDLIDRRDRKNVIIME